MTRLDWDAGAGFPAEKGGKVTIRRKPGKRGLIRPLPLVLALACLLAALTLALPGPGCAAEAAQGIRVELNGREIKTDVLPQLVQDRVLVAVRAVAEALGATVNWDGERRLVALTFSGENLARRLALVNLHDRNFLDPPGWTASIPGMDEDVENAKRELVAAFRRAQVIEGPCPEGGSPALYRFHTPAQWGNASGALVQVTHSGRYARLEVYGHPEDVP